VAILTTPSVAIRNSTLRTTRWLMLELTAVVDPRTGATEADQVLGALQNGNLPRIKAAYDAMSADGIDLSDPQVQRMIDVIGSDAGWPQDLIDRIKQAGVRMVTPLANVALPVPTEAEAQAAWKAGKLLERRIGWNERIDVAKNKLGTIEHADGEAELLAVIDEASTVPGASS
jgi:hypothetical protein